MKYFLLFFTLLAFRGDTKPDYNLLIGSWMQKQYKGTPDTGVFSFSQDSILKLEMFKGETEEPIASVTGKYSINRKEKTLTLNVLGTLKTFNIIALKKETMTIKNTTDNKDAQTFERLEAK